MNQGLLNFPGLTNVQAASFTLSRGIRPSVATVEILPQASLPNVSGDMVFSFGSTKVTFKKCKVDRNNYRRDSSGFIWGLDIFDRRWAWTGNGHISGRYNLRKEDGLIDEDTEKKPRELAKLCLEAMGERGYDTSKMPDDARPEIEWDYSNPAEALDELCEATGCEVVLGLNDRVSIHPVGVGRDLPGSPTVYSESLSLDLPEQPDSILLVGAPIRYQDRFTLVPVGLDVDGKVKDIDDLSYKPANGWGDPSFFADIEDEDERRLAVQSVWLWYRIDKFADGTLKHPHYKKALKKITQCLPLEDAAAQVYVDFDGKTKQQPAIVHGVFYDGQGKGDNTEVGTVYPFDFSIDGERGIVRFSDAVFKRDDDGEVLPAVITLEVAHALRDNETDTWIRYTKAENLRSGQRFGTKARVVKREDLQQTVWHFYNDSNGRVQSTTDNVRDVDKDAKPYMEALKAEYLVVGSSERSYHGIMAIEPDGAIAQVTWTVGVDTGASTKASYNNQHDMTVPTTKERRALQHLRLERLKEVREASKPVNQKRMTNRKLR